MVTKFNILVPISGKRAESLLYYSKSSQGIEPVLNPSMLDSCKLQFLYNVTFFNVCDLLLFLKHSQSLGNAFIGIVMCQ